MEKMQTLYNLLQINLKIPNKSIRLLYLKDIWGIDQNTIALCEGSSQSYVSKELLVARKMFNMDDVKRETENIFTGKEIEFIQMLPREILSDMECFAFITDLLEVKPYHPFFQFYDTEVNVKIAALSSLGVQNKRLEKLYNKSQSTVSMVIKRNSERVKTLERSNRYDKVEDYLFQIKPQIFTFRKAGGSE